MPSVVRLQDVSVVRNGVSILDQVSWQVDEADRWVVLGANGAGKTTLLQVAGAQSFPTSGTVEVLGTEVGGADLFELRPRIGFASTALARRIPVTEQVLDVVLTAAYSVTGRWNEQYDDIDVRRAHRVLDEWGLGGFADRTFGELSDGEQKRVQIARSVMTDPEVLFLDEPAASLDLGARESLVRTLGGYAESAEAPAIVVVTHHVEEIPKGFTHALVLAEGRVHTAGPIADVVTSEVLSDAFGIGLVVTADAGRYTARAS
ncbi:MULTISPECIES: ABC transporter ATP-binding protein [unclassified Curtobacterium]|uniref:ABC transporter ATP-binding protein n=1 Tax=unclassified Curtobacterium TaxID=257496 RepID=UPI000DA80246|nr:MULTISPECIES: ABC transporter ATP-binding protein [unclassified Curtobacterium]PZE28766.1 ABC transporter ATP-binding protein [Curtobacterium sp. MCBD17_028]PZE77117.1 ABC transporter ATP-binding protein [Curtobacterium sp. MCBD17_019]PZF59203.1 ABC transporter ATP-binding protein [Curtobacterium sp. MCBD17_034]PZF65137.1 ABC transporter ATP-binding protein [Curtobacterium sp. MCBD17_013]PZM34255.1 ABC transporter ATP-binding protein [Curtobacterium sp. MCBD17_031]